MCLLVTPVTLNTQRNHFHTLGRPKSWFSSEYLIDAAADLPSKQKSTSIFKRQGSRKAWLWCWSSVPTQPHSCYCQGTAVPASPGWKLHPVHQKTVLAIGSASLRNQCLINTLKLLRFSLSILVLQHSDKGYVHWLRWYSGLWWMLPSISALPLPCSVFFNTQLSREPPKILPSRKLKMVISIWVGRRATLIHPFSLDSQSSMKWNTGGSSTQQR